MIQFNSYQLSQQLGKNLLARGWLIAVAESCTGGGLAYYLTSVVGSSQWFERGFVTYTNVAKVELLGVQEKTLHHFGAVSPETAIEMARGTIKHSHAHVSLSITGIAGPTGGSIDKPVGTVCFGLALRDTVISCEWRKELFDGGRKNVRDRSIHYALSWLLEVTKS